jgi:hypothetical protein
MRIHSVGATRHPVGQLDSAFTMLGRGIAVRDAGVPPILSFSVLDVLHDDPRWAALLRRARGGRRLRDLPVGRSTHASPGRQALIGGTPHDTPRHTHDDPISRPSALEI